MPTMGSIGSWWVRGPEPRPGESVTAGYYANYLRADGRPIGGKLYLTTDRLVFCPHLIDAALGASATTIAIDDVEAVERFDPTDDANVGMEVAGGGTQERLLVRRRDDRDEFFIVNDLDGILETVGAVTADDPEVAE